MLSYHDGPGGAPTRRRTVIKLRRVRALVCASSAISYFLSQDRAILNVVVNFTENFALQNVERCVFRNVRPSFAPQSCIHTYKCVLKNKAVVKTNIVSEKIQKVLAAVK